MSGTRPGQTSPDDEFVLFLAACGVLAAVAGSAGLLWLAGVSWLVEHQVLVGADEHPILALPGGAGLDGSRLAIAIAIVLGLLAWAVSAIVHKVAAGREIQ